MKEFLNEDVIMQLQAVGKFAELIEYCKENIELLKKNGEDNSAIAEGLEILANVYYHVGEFESSALSSRRALKILEVEVGKHDPIYCRCLIGLGQTLMRDKQYDEAELFLNQAVRTLTSLTGSQRWLTVGLINLGNLHSAREQYQKAEQLLLQAVSAGVKEFEYLSANFGKIFISLGGLYRRMQRAVESEKTLKKALRIIENSNDGISCDRAQCLHSLGRLYEDLGFIEKAKKYYKNAVSLLEKFCPMNDRYLQSAKNSLEDINS